MSASSCSSRCLALHCYHGNHNCASAPKELTEFAVSFLFSLGFSERLVNPRKSLDVNILLADLLRASKVSFSAFALGLLYMRRYAARNPANLQYSVYPVFVTALMAASKYLEDNTYTNKTWSILTGFKLFELNGLEMHFLQALGFSMHVPEAEYSEWLAQLLAFAGQQQPQEQLWQPQLWQQQSPSAEEEGAMLAPSSPAGVFRVSHAVIKSQIIHLQTHHLGAAFRPQLPPPQLPEGPTTLKARRTRSRSPTHHKLILQQQQQHLPPISSLMSSPTAMSRKHLASSSPLKPYPDLVTPGALLPTHLPRVAPVFRSTSTTLNDYLSQLQNMSPGFINLPKTQTLPSHSSLDDLLGKTTF